MELDPMMILEEPGWVWRMIMKTSTESIQKVALNQNRLLKKKIAHYNFFFTKATATSGVLSHNSHKYLQQNPG